ncbi:beta-1,3-N-acetylglucosaminyltransferase radical fringe [Protopterus annectens]|uniref:beta-1,3-N-acetylglucosaminyltransferase radical fringe n=1 Tax=Protopterus annectens TaxID=7888 RepID=UPI001CFB1C90|nr:beta-1,3-N-acetylglucosaminyltransferase radical fringe [Protopterus annectens]
MTISWFAFSKLCFLLSVTICAFLLLLVPGFHLLRKPADLLQLRWSLSANRSLERVATTHLITSGVVSVLDVFQNRTVHQFLGEVGNRRWSHLSQQMEKQYPQAGVEEEEEEEDIIAEGPGETALEIVKESLQPLDIFIAVKTTRKYHKSRVELLLQTWISRAKEQTLVFRDTEDRLLRSEMSDHLINTNCSAVHTRQALCCKMSVEYDKFLDSGRKWFCHVDDDNYINVDRLMQLLSSYLHTQDIYVGKPSLDHPVEAAEKVKSDGSVSRLETNNKKRYNLTYDEYMALKLESSEDIIIKQADKGGALVVMDRDNYIASVIALLDDGDAFKCISFVDVKKHISNVNMFVYELQINGDIDLDLFHFFTVPCPVIPQLLCLGNFISTAEKVRLPDDCTIGYIVEALLEVKMIHSPLFHSHLENLQQLPTSTILNQVTLSYGGPENKYNVVSVRGAFSLDKDPTRFRSVHCLLYPDTAWCPSKRKLGFKS